MIVAGWQRLVRDVAGAYGEVREGIVFGPETS